MLSTSHAVTAAPKYPEDAAAAGDPLPFDIPAPVSVDTSTSTGCQGPNGISSGVVDSTSSMGMCAYRG